MLVNLVFVVLIEHGAKLYRTKLYLSIRCYIICAIISNTSDTLVSPAHSDIVRFSSIFFYLYKVQTLFFPPTCRKTGCITGRSGLLKYRVYFNTLLFLNYLYSVQVVIQVVYSDQHTRNNRINSPISSSQEYSKIE